MAYFFAFIVLLVLIWGYLFSKKVTIIFVAIIFSVVIFHLVSISDGHSWGDDFIVYLAQAKSLLQHNINAVIAKQELIQQLSKNKSGPILYPWGYPVFLAVLINFFGDNYVVYKALNIAAICATALATTFFTEPVKRKSLCILFLLIALNPFLFDFKNEINADILLMLLTTFSLLFIKRINSAANEKPSIVLLLTAGLVFFLCTFVKAAGMIIFPVFIFCIAYVFSSNKKKGRPYSRKSWWAVVIVSAVYAALLYITGKLLPNFVGDYLDYYSFRSIVKAITNNFTFYVFLLKNFVYNSNSLLYFTSLLISSCLFLLGVALHFKKYLYLNLFSLVFFFTLIITPYTGGVRYLLPLLPIFFLYTFLGAEYLYLHKGRPLSVSGLLGILFLLFSFCVNDFESFYKKNRVEKVRDGAFSPKAKEFYHFLQKTTTARDTLAFFKPRFLSFYLNRVAASYYDTLPLRSSAFTYLTIYRNLNSGKKELEMILPGYLKNKIFDNGDFQVYKLK